MQIVRLQAGLVNLEGILSIPDNATRIVVVAYPSGSNRHLSRSEHLIEEFNEYGFAVLLFDLLTESEETQDLKSGEIRFNVPLLADRVIGALEWLSRQETFKNLKIGLMGTSTSAAAVMVAAARLGTEIKAVVSRSGRPDLAGESLKHVSAPTLLIVGEHDFPVMELNQYALRELECEKRLEVVPKAGHQFTESGSFEQVARLARHWFLDHLL